MPVPDNYDIWEAHDTQQQRAIENLPVCAYCEQPIQQDDAVQIDWYWYCDNCLENFLRKDIVA